MSKSTKKKWFIGIDISKDTLDLAALNVSAVNVFKQKKVSNDVKGFEAILTWMTSFKIKQSEAFFCMEHTGTYGLLLFAWLSQKGIDFSVIPGLEIKNSLGITRGKNDKIDACRIATYALEKREKLVCYELPGKKIVEIKQLLTYRDQLVKIKTGLMNSLKSHLQYAQVTEKSLVTDDISAEIIHLDEKIKTIEKEIVNIIKSDETLQKNFKLASSVKGIGLIIAAAIVVSSNNFQSFTSGRSYACYAGTAPFEHSSGSSIKKKSSVSYIGNKRIKSLLSNGANAASKWDPELNAYYRRKREEGKDHKLVMNAISCKLINRVFATVKRGTPYVITYGQNFSKKNLVLS